MITNEDIKYVIVQAGGKGTRMEHFAYNRPKCLVPVNDVPMIVNTLNIYKDKQVIIIADHLADVLETYLKTFYKRKNYTIHRTNESGTAGGLRSVTDSLPDEEPFIVTWADLFFEKEQEFSTDQELLIALSNTFKCRWSLTENNELVNVSSTDRGIAGFFVFKNKSKFKNIKVEKSLVRGFLTDFYSPEKIDSFYLNGCFEVGEKEKYEDLLEKKLNHRFFNEVKIVGDKIHKKCVDPNYFDVHEKEKNWYKFVNEKYSNVPKIHSFDPLVMDKIEGKHLWDVTSNKEKIITNYCDALDSLHSLGKKKSSPFECMSVYYTKSWKRVSEVFPVIKHLNQPSIKINGINCQNPIYNLEVFEDYISGIVNNTEYNVIHGDPTFSNTLVDNSDNIWMIDPRGVFGETLIYGDKRYDWAKLYYSAVGNYDSMNSKKFKIKLDESGVDLEIKSSGFEEYGDFIIERSGMTKMEMELIHTSIWLSLTAYVKEDLDAVLYSFYRGCQLWTEAISN